MKIMRNSILSSIKLGQLIYDKKGASYIVISTGRTGHQYDRYDYVNVLNENGALEEIPCYNIKIGDFNKVDAALYSTTIE